MGLYGCIDVQGAWEDTNAKHKEVKTVVQALIRALWPGKVPRASCFLAYGAFGHIWVWKGVHVFLCVHCGAETWAERKTTEKEAQMLVPYLFCDACQGKTKTWSWQGLSRWPERIMGVNGGKERGPHRGYICKAKMLLHICKKKHQKNRKRASANCLKPLFFKQNKQHAKQAKKQGKTL